MPLRGLLELAVEDQRTWYLKTLAMLAYPVVERTVEQGLSDLEWGGYLTRTRARKGDKRARIVSITPLGRKAISEPLFNEALDSLPHRHRTQSAYPHDPALDQRMRRVWEGFR